MTGYPVHTGGSIIFFEHLYLSSLHCSFGKEGIPQSTILTFLTDVAFLRSTNCVFTLANAQTFCPFSGAGFGIESSAVLKFRNKRVFNIEIGNFNLNLKFNNFNFKLSKCVI